MKKVFFAGFVALFIIAGLSACKPPAQEGVQADVQTDEVAVDTSQEKEDGIFSGSIKDLIGLDVSQKCTMTENGKVVGVIYVDGERVRMDGSDGQAGMSSMINDGEWIYMWDTATKSGMKMKNEDTEEMVAESEGEVEVDVDEEMTPEGIGEAVYDYSCGKWKVDESVFVPPTDVEFQDMDAMLKQMEVQMEGMVPPIGQ